MSTLPIPPLPFPISIESNQILVFITEGRQRRGLTELIAQLALRGPFQMIPGGQWVPDQDDLYTALKQYTTNADEVLPNLHLRTPETHLKMLNMMSETSQRNDPLLILDFLHHFYVEDIDTSRRKRMVEQCCEHLQKAKLARPVVIFMQEKPTEDYELFHPTVVSIADDFVHLERGTLLEALMKGANMGNKLPSARGLAEKLKEKIQYIGTLINPADRVVMKQFGEWTLQHAVEIHRSTKMAPMEADLTMISMELYKKIDLLANELHTYMQESDREKSALREEIEELKALNERA